MFDQFGEFDSVEELNLAAAGLLKEGDTKSLKALARENGIEEEDVNDYIAGMTKELVTLYSAAYGRLLIEEEKVINKKKNVMEKMPLQLILTMLRGMCTSEELARAVMKKGKCISNIYQCIRSEAEKHKSGNMGMACGTDRELCEMIRTYYMESDQVFKEKVAAIYK
ncbi:hypothetical protein [Lachnotalea glycerini]|uniref:Uncharacterized protein n=1 Tax=Lachnotalea glycerini TaxID=1763509 RepID=A0A371JC57_9FIRM|nr:hypothetical protein [Lachnotalea glycerini]RDY30313.1 hypothetical protein CG710_015380 [Lachnotalea glycerini]